MKFKILFTKSNQKKKMSKHNISKPMMKSVEDINTYGSLVDGKN